MAATTANRPLQEEVAEMQANLHCHACSS